MSTISRDVVIRVAVEGVKGDLKLPDYQTATNQATSYSESITQATASTVELGKASAATATETAKAGFSLTQASEGAFKIARGLALATGASQESTQEMLRLFATFHSGIDTMRGTEQLLKQLSVSMPGLASSMAALPTIIGGVTIALGAGMQMWAQYANEMKALRDGIKEMEGALDSMAVANVTASNASQMRSAGTLNGMEKEIALAKVQSDIQSQLSRAGSAGLSGAAQAELELQLREQLIQVAMEEQGISHDTLRSQEDEIRNRERSLQLATDLLRKEEERVKGMQVAVGQLTKMEQLQLERLVTKIESDEPLSRRETQQLQRLGQGDLARDQYANRGDTELTDRLLRLKGGGSQVESLEQARDQTQQSLGVQDGESPEQAVARSLKELRDKNAEEKKEQNALIRDMIKQIDESRAELAKLKQAEIVRRGMGGR